MEDLYIRQQIDGHQIAARFGVTPPTIYRWMRWHGIPVRKAIVQPSWDELHELYIVRKLSTRRIAKLLGCCRNRVMAWVAEYGFERLVVPGSLADKGVGIPSKDVLSDLVHVQHKTYEEIGIAYGVTACAVKFWVHSRGITPPTSSYTKTKGRLVAIDAASLINLHLDEHLTLREIADRIGVGSSTIFRLFRKLGVQIKPPGQRRFFYVTDDGFYVASTYERRVGNWLFSKGIAYKYNAHLPFGTTHRSDFMANGIHVEIWGVEGDAAYEFRKQWKQAQYQLHQLPLVELMPKHFRKSGEWAAIFAKHFLK